MRQISTLLGCLITILPLAALNAVAQAEQYPAKTITILLGSGAGSSVDAMARILASAAEKDLGQPIMVSNRSGGDGAIAMGALLNAPADGYTIWGGTKTYPVSVSTNLDGRFNPKDFKPLLRVQTDPFALIVKNDSKWKTLAEFLEDGKKKSLNVGGFGSSSPHGLFNFKLARMSGAKLAWIPYGAGSQALTALLGDHLDAVLSNPSTIVKQLEAGQVRVLAMASDKRSPLLPDIPTFKEQGLDLVDTQWRGLFVKSGTPTEIVSKLDRAFSDAIRTPAFQDYLRRTSQEDGYMGPDEFNNFVAHEFTELTGIKDDFLKSFQ